MLHAHLQLLHQLFQMCFGVTPDCDSAILHSALPVAQEACYHSATLRRVRTASLVTSRNRMRARSQSATGNAAMYSSKDQLNQVEVTRTKAGCMRSNGRIFPDMLFCICRLGQDASTANGTDSSY
jgi:hypothetical protein